MPQVRTLALAICAMSGTILPGCGYQFQRAHNPLIDLGIHKIYVAGFRNDTYRPGIEHFFTTAMVREIGHSKSFELVNSRTEADAVLSGQVTASEDTVTATSGLTVGTRAVNVASEFDANVACQIVLVDRRGREIFRQSVTGDKVHPGSAQLGDRGATAPLTNDSEHRLAVQFLASEMMASVYQRMVDTF